MTDDIFDYFGESARKVEPVENDDFFDDLMPKIETPAESESPQEESQASAVDDATASTVDAAPAKKPVEQATRAESNDEPDSQALRPYSSSESDGRDDVDDFDMETHWDSLAESLGLESPSKALESDDLADERESQPSAAVENEGSDDFFGLEVDDDDEPVADVLAEMFPASPSTDEQERGNSVEAIEADIDDDPFAAFHRSTNPVVSEDASGAENDDAVAEKQEPHLVVSDDFVEFEVKEFDQGQSDRSRRGRSERGKRSDAAPRGGRRGDRSGEGRRPWPKTDDLEGGDVSDSSDKPSKGGRRRRQRDSDVKVERPAEIEGKRDRDESESTGRRRSRPNRERDRSTGDRDRDTEAKKPKIPTWDEAINSVIEKNIQRHKSGNRSGGRRRR